MSYSFSDYLHSRLTDFTRRSEAFTKHLTTIGPIINLPDPDEGNSLEVFATLKLTNQSLSTSSKFPSRLAWKTLPSRVGFAGISILAIVETALFGIAKFFTTFLPFHQLDRNVTKGLKSAYSTIISASKNIYQKVELICEKRSE